MGLWSQGMKNVKAGLRVRGGVLLKCNSKNSTITIGDDIEAVANNAFEGCENVKINKSEQFILSELKSVGPFNETHRIRF